MLIFIISLDNLYNIWFNITIRRNRHMVRKSVIRALNKEYCKAESIGRIKEKNINNYVICGIDRNYILIVGLHNIWISYNAPLNYRMFLYSDIKTEKELHKRIRQKLELLRCYNSGII